MAFCAPEMIPWIGPNDCWSDGAGRLKMLGTGATAGNGFTNPLIGTATGTGKIIGDFFKFFKMAAVLAILATLIALAAFKAPTLSAIVFFATRNGAVMALKAASFVAFAY